MLHFALRVLHLCVEYILIVTCATQISVCTHGSQQIQSITQIKLFCCFNCNLMILGWRTRNQGLSGQRDFGLQHISTWNIKKYKATFEEKETLNSHDFSDCAFARPEIRAIRFEYRAILHPSSTEKVALKLRNFEI